MIAAGKYHPDGKDSQRGDSDLAAARSGALRVGGRDPAYPGGVRRDLKHQGEVPGGRSMWRWPPEYPCPSRARFDMSFSFK